MISEGLMQNLQVTGLCDDSRRVKPGNLFFSMPTEGAEEFAQKALDAGAVAVVAEMPAPEKLTAKWIQVMDVRRARLEAAKIFYKDPFGKLTAHAVTGTNGKTTSAFLMDAMLTAAGHKVAQAQFKFINPLPKNTADVLLRYKKVVVAAQNMGQLAAYLRSKVDGFVPEQFNQVKGQPFVVSELVNAFENILKK